MCVGGLSGGSLGTEGVLNLQPLNLQFSAIPQMLLMLSPSRSQDFEYGGLHQPKRGATAPQRGPDDERLRRWGIRVPYDL